MTQSNPMQYDQRPMHIAVDPTKPPPTLRWMSYAEFSALNSAFCGLAVRHFGVTAVQEYEYLVLLSPNEKVLDCWEVKRSEQD